MIREARPAAIGVATDDPLAIRRPSSMSVSRRHGQAAATPSPTIARLQSGVDEGLRGEGFASPSLE